MTAEEFRRLRHIAWDYNDWSERDEQSFCICTTPEQHGRYEMDPTGDKAKEILG